MNGSIRLYNILLDKNFTKEEAEIFVSELEDAIDRKVDKGPTGLRGEPGPDYVTQTDLNKAVIGLKEDLNKAVIGLKEDLNKAVLDLKGDIIDVKGNVTSIIMWVVGIALGQTGLIFLILQLVGAFE